MRLIDADALCAEIDEYVYPITTNNLMGAADAYFRIKHIIEQAPTIEARPAVRGEWEMDAKYNCHCSNCHEGRNIGTQIGWNFCPYCGAKMDGGEK